MTHFADEHFEEATFERVDLSRARFSSVDFSSATFRGADFTGATFRSVDFIDVRLDGEIEDLVINGVDVAPLVQAELDRRDPLRVAMRPTDAAGFREAWTLVESLWDQTVARAQRVDPSDLHRSVNGEWSFIETLRHLVFATDSWVRRALLGDPAPWHPLGLPWSEMDDTPGVPRDRDARPTLEEMLVIRRDRMAGVRDVIEGLSDAALATMTTPVESVGWPPAESFGVQQCLRIVLNEEYLHRLFAERDLDLIEAASSEHHAP